MGTGKGFALKIYKQVLPSLPPEEKWNPNQQIRRSSLSVSANIAEGYGNFYYQENIRFCHIARGSLDETLSHLTFGYEAKFISDTLYDEFQKEGEEIDKMLNGYISYLKRSKQGANEPGANIGENSAPYVYDLFDDSSINEGTEY